jgi:membrane protein implicated in regulation of membrane protease activity
MNHLGVVTMAQSVTLLVIGVALTILVIRLGRRYLKRYRPRIGDRVVLDHRVGVVDRVRTPWLRVRMDGRLRWVNNKYVTPTHRR